MLADDVGAQSYGASTTCAYLHSHSAPMSCSYFCYGATSSPNQSIWTHSNFTSTAALHASVPASHSHSDVVGELSRPILPTGILSTFAIGISLKWLPDVFQKTKVTQKLSKKLLLLHQIIVYLLRPAGK